MSRHSARWAPKARRPRRDNTLDDQHELWRTPGPVVEQGLYAARDIGGVERWDRIADLGAGSGSFGQRARRALPGAHQLALEVRPEEHRHLRRHYDEVVLRDMFESVSRLRRYAPHLVVANPPYSLALAALIMALSVVAIGGHVLFCLRSTFGSSVEAWDFLRATPPVHEFGVAGRPQMRQAVAGASNRDLVPHIWLLFRRGHRPRHPAWIRHPLPPLAPSDLTWTVIPGTEDHIPEFPAHYRSAT